MTDLTVTDASRGQPAITKSTSTALNLMLDTALFERAKEIAKMMAGARGFMPGHLVGQSEACFAVVVRSITWNLDPYAVAQSTYQTPGGAVGFEGKLCQAILENSPAIEGPVKYEHFGTVYLVDKDGAEKEYRTNDPMLDDATAAAEKVTGRTDWSAVQGKFEIAKGKTGKPFAKRTWTSANTAGLGVTVSAQVRGEAEPRTLHFYLAQAWPLNSTLWATDPMTQICYTAMRRFGSVCTPGLFMGVPFDDGEAVPGDRARDITPARPDVRSYEAQAEAADETYRATIGDTSTAQPEPEQDALIGDDEIEPPRAFVLLADADQTAQLEFMADMHRAILAAPNVEWLDTLLRINRPGIDQLDELSRTSMKETVGNKRADLADAAEESS